MLLEPFSDFFRGFFQVGYVTTDLDRAVNMFKSRYSIRDFVRIPISTRMKAWGSDEEAEVNFECALANVGTTQVELICAPGAPVYSEGLPKEGFGLTMHHLACIVPGGDTAWTSFREQVRAQKRKVALEHGSQSPLKWIYLDEREVGGHFVEYCSDNPALHLHMLKPPVS